MEPTSDEQPATWPRDVYLDGGPLDGRTVTVEGPCYELHFGGPEVAYRVTSDRNVWRYRPPTTAD